MPDYIKHHLLLLAAVAVLVFGTIYGIESLIVRHDAANAAKFQQILQEQQKQTAMLEARLAEREAFWEQQNQQQTRRIQQLEEEITQRNTELEKIKQTNSTLSAQQAAAKLAKQTEASEQQVSALENSVQMELPIAIRVIDTFDSYKVLQQNFSDLQEQFEAQKQIAANLRANLDAQNELIAAKNTQIADMQKAHDSEIAALKANTRKSKLKWAVIGAVVGMIGKGLIGL